MAYFWDNHLRQHFREEEELLFEKVNDDYCGKAVKQHRELSNLIRQVESSTSGPTPDLLNQLADQLDAHIRFEERELFPHLEAVLDEQELISIGAILAQSHETQAKDTFPDEFWIK
ncbi:hypothetical protein AAE02nite_27010 [Adhaeribacter aerolatus]|uniref:Hemerythrin-like domain-containing protein n=1 Tax=Adhaeribacter aerolatus TaxID=670289 RepID=A0A512AZT5_9BACT|nr:hypothetical protein AAE02nite_27010 [Adhaeribacter aerolatus]